MSAKQSKRARFAHRQRVWRLVACIKRRNSGRPGFVGACIRLTITDEYGNSKNFGSGAMFLETTDATTITDTARRRIITSITRD